MFPTRTAAAPALITLDVHEHPRLNAVLIKAAEFLSQINQKATFFCPAALVRGDRQIARTLLELQGEGHHIGCHGLTHTREEDPFSLSATEELTLLRTATSILEDLLGRAVFSFRAPVYRLSDRTLPILESLGYKADLSVVPQRVCFFSSTPWSFRGVLAPRGIYHPDEKSPYRRGNLSIVEIPNSCFLLPIAHGAMTGFRSKGMAAILACLMWEARNFKRVLVLSFHPETLAGDDLYYPNRRLRWADLVPRRYGGMALRYHFTDMLPEKSQQIAREVMFRVQERLDCMSVEKYVDSVYLNGKRSEHFIGVAET